MPRETNSEVKGFLNELPRQAATSLLSSAAGSKPALLSSPLPSSSATFPCPTVSLEPRGSRPEFPLVTNFSALKARLLRYELRWPRYLGGIPTSFREPTAYVRPRKVARAIIRASRKDEISVAYQTSSLSLSFYLSLSLCSSIEVIASVFLRRVVQSGRYGWKQLRSRSRRIRNAGGACVCVRARRVD